MELNINMFPKYKYISKSDENLELTKGKEYYRVDIGKHFHNNTYGVYMTTDNYEGTDIDYCVFLPLDTFNKKFEADIPEKINPKYKSRHRKQYLKRKKKIELAKNIASFKYVERKIEENDIGKLFKLRYRCDCYMCTQTNSASTVRREQNSLSKIKEYEEDLLLQREESR